MKLKDKVVLITGGGSGLGREMGLTFAREGAKIGVNDIRPESAQNVVTEIERAGGKARPRHFTSTILDGRSVRQERMWTSHREAPPPSEPASYQAVVSSAPPAPINEAP